ncbi:MAG: SCO family protein [Planctomycetota bacterium]|jgi:protein SCO1/2
MIRRSFHIVSAGALALVASEAVCAQMTSDVVPPEFEGVGIEDKRGDMVPLDLEFTNSDGERVRLGEYFRPGRPVIITLNYYTCPQLCDLVLNEMVNGLNQLEWSAGGEFDIVTVSINPEEEFQFASAKKRAYLTQYKRDSVARGWNFHVGEEQNIAELADALGWGFRYDEKTGEYAHPSAIMFCTPDGRISVYMDEVAFDANDLRLALVEASQGAIGSALDHIKLFFCFQYDPESNSYRIVAWKVMRGGALLTMLLLGSGLGFLWYRDLKLRHLQAGVET